MVTLIGIGSGVYRFQMNSSYSSDSCDSSSTSATATTNAPSMLHLLASHAMAIPTPSLTQPVSTRSFQIDVAVLVPATMSMRMIQPKRCCSDADAIQNANRCWVWRLGVLDFTVRLGGIGIGISEASKRVPIFDRGTQTRTRSKYMPYA